MSTRRVVVTGMGVVAPNGHGIEAFERALRGGLSGIRAQPQLAALGFRCLVGGIPEDQPALASYFDEADPGRSTATIYGNVAAIDAWRDAGLPQPDPNAADPTVGAIVGTGLACAETLSWVVHLVEAGNTRRLGSRAVENTMASAVTAQMAGLLGLGNQVSSNSSACSTGTEAIVMAAERIRAGLAERMLAGGAEGASHFTWAGFDAMRVLDCKHNDEPARASRPMSATAGGFVPAAGAGVLHLEDLDHALGRGARIYAEVLGGAINCGGHRQGGSMTAPNSHAARACIRQALNRAGLSPERVDAISGHLTGTFADPVEVKNWSIALERGPDSFPWINAPKSLFGHALGAAGGIECVAAILQLYKRFLHPSLNCEDLHTEVAPFGHRIPQTAVEPDRLDVIAKASFGFGDVNSCVLFSRFTD